MCRLGFPALVLVLLAGCATSTPSPAPVRDCSAVTIAGPPPAQAPAQSPDDAVIDPVTLAGSREARVAEKKPPQ